MKEGTPEREKNREKAWEEYNAQILLDARKNARLTQAELAKRIGADKGYISRIERGLTVPTVSTLYRIAAAMGQWNYGLCKIKPDSPDCPKKPCHALFQGAELRGITRIFLYLFRVIREIRA